VCVGVDVLKITLYCIEWNVYIKGKKKTRKEMAKHKAHLHNQKDGNYLKREETEI
jgi:phage terminase small subunit